MTAAQKNIITLLIQKGSIAHLGPSGIRLRDEKGSVKVKVSPRTFRAVKGLIKRNKKGLWVLSKKEILGLHGASWAKKEYKALK